MIRLLAFGLALRGTAGLAWLCPRALQFTRWLAPAGVRREVDLRFKDAALVEACGAVDRLTAEIHTAWDARDAMGLEKGEAFERDTIRPLMARRRVLAEQANALAVHGLRGHQARARMVLAWRGVPEPGEIGHEAEPSLWVLVRGLAA